MGKAERRLRRMLDAPTRKLINRKKRGKFASPSAVTMVDDGRRFFVAWNSPGKIMYTLNTEGFCPDNHMEVLIGVQILTQNLVFKYPGSDSFVHPWGKWKGSVEFVEIPSKTVEDRELEEAEMRNANEQEC